MFSCCEDHRRRGGVLCATWMLCAEQLTPLTHHAAYTGPVRKRHLGRLLPGTTTKVSRQPAHQQDNTCPMPLLPHLQRVALIIVVEQPQCQHNASSGTHSWPSWAWCETARTLDRELNIGCRKEAFSIQIWLARSITGCACQCAATAATPAASALICNS